MKQPISDPALRAAYEALAAARRGAAVPDIPVETIAELASGTYRGDDRIELLDRVLGHPVTARELRFFSELAQQAPATVAPVRRPVPWLGLAATITLAVGAGSLWLALGPGSAEPVRGDRAAFELVEPKAGAGVSPGDRLTWRSAIGAGTYRLELLDGDGAVVFAAPSADTVFVVPEAVRMVAGERYQVRLVAALLDGTSVAAPVVTVVAR